MFSNLSDERLNFHPIANFTYSDFDLKSGANVFR